MALHLLRKIALPFIAIASVALSSCQVHQFPEPCIQDEVTLRLHLDYSTDLPLHKLVDYKDITRSAADVDLDDRAGNSNRYDRRYTLNFYSCDEEGRYERVPALTHVVTAPSADVPDTDIDINIPRGRYHLIVWTDHVAAGSNSHLFYNPDDVSAICVHGDEHVGNTDFRDAFHGTADIDAGSSLPPLSSPEAMPERPVVNASVSSVRPMAKFNILTTDLDEFISRAEGSRADRANSRSDIKRSVELSDFTILVKYPTYMPSVFNGFTGKPADSATGKSFTAAIHTNDDGDIEIGFDYILVNGSEASVQVAVEVYDYDGTQLSASGTMTLPLVRSKLTTVSGEFLTISTGGSIGVDPSYENDFNIVIK